MITKRSQFGELLGRFHPTQKPTQDLHRGQLMVACAQLAERMHAVRDAIHSEAGQNSIYEEVYAQPHEFFRRYVFEKDNIDFHMSLAIVSAGATMRFSSFTAKHWIGRLINPFGNPIGKIRVNIKCQLLIDPATVTDTDLEQWFTYLLSGLRRSFKPANRIPRPKDS